MTLKDLQYFLMVCEHKSVRKAAPKAYISPQGLNKVIHNIEQAVGAQLFTREHGVYETTVYGERYRQYARQVLDASTAMEADIDRIRLENAGAIRLAYSRILSGTNVMDRLDAFRTHHPGCPLDLVRASDVDVHNLATAAPPMLALTIAPCRTNGLTLRPLKRHRYVLMTAESHPLAARQAVGIPDLEGQRLILLDDGHMCNHNIVAYCRQAGFAPNLAYEASGAASAKMLCEQDKGVFVMMEFLGDALDLSGVKLIPFTAETPTWDTVFLHAADYTPTRQEQLLMDYLAG